jgi:hypothetical protein
MGDIAVHTVIAEIVFSHEFHLLLDMINICYMENLFEIIWELELCLDKFRDFIMNKENYWKCGWHIKCIKID